MVVVHVVKDLYRKSGEEQPAEEQRIHSVVP